MIDLEDIQKKVSKVISFSQGISYPEVRPLLDRWYDAKQEFINLFDSQLIYEIGHIQVNLTEEEKKEKVNKFVKDIQDNLSLYTDYSDELIDFIENNKDNFFTNIVESPFKQGDIYIPAGIKITKAFKFFFDDKEKLDKIQTMASMILQEVKVEGTLCFSVHPLDYLSSSENACNWRSCHALDGEYRAGNLSYMLDKSTIVCYLKEENGDTRISRFPRDVPWNNKKWRMLLFVSDDHNALFAGRQYPFFSKNLLELIRINFLTKINSYSSPHDWSNWHNDCLKGVEFKEYPDDNFVLPKKYFFLNGDLYKDSSLIEDVGLSSEKLHFNDLLYSSFYTPYYCWLWSYKAKIHFTIGALVPCLRCGENFIESHDSMICESCGDDKITCDYCGDIINEDDAIYLEDREITVCRDCYSEIFAEEY
jgi:hypothetical protein